MAVDLYILGMILFWLGVFRTPIGGWRIWAPISYASFFAYLFHRPIWELLVSVFPISDFHLLVLFKLIPASIVVFFISYFLQYGYDRFLVLFRQGKRSF